MSDDLQCWKCGQTLSGLSLPLSRQDECPACRAQLYVCRLCTFFDPAVANRCREPVADPVQDKTRANFCGYFAPRPGAWTPGTQPATSAAAAELGALFGEEPAAGTAAADSAEEAAKKAFDDLFVDSGDNT